MPEEGKEPERFRKMIETHTEGEEKATSMLVSVRINAAEQKLLAFIMEELGAKSKARALRMALIGYAAVVANMKKP